MIKAPEHSCLVSFHLLFISFYRDKKNKNWQSSGGSTDSAFLNEKSSILPDSHQIWQSTFSNKNLITKIIQMFELKSSKSSNLNHPTITLKSSK